MRALVMAALLLAACGEGTVIEVTSVPADYTDWYRVDATGSVPGHGDSYRIIRANQLARLRGVVLVDSIGRELVSPTYPVGSVLIKEVRALDPGDQPGALRYTAIMRKLNVEQAPEGAEIHQVTEVRGHGWLFTYLAGDVTAPEEYRPSCWRSCHQAAPIDGAFLDYGGE
jgi:hypothetical protein